MATKKRSPKKSPARLTFKNRSVKSWQALAIITIIVAIGVWQLIDTFAAPTQPVPEDHVVVQLTHAGGQIAHKASDGTLIYDQKAVDIRLTDDGKLLCDNGTADSYDQATLSRHEVNDLQQKISQSGLAIEPAVDTALTNAPEQNAVEADTLVFGLPDKTVKAVSAARGATKKPAFQKLEKTLRDLCSRPVKRVKNSALLSAPSPLASGVHAIKVQDVTASLMPKVQAASTTISGEWKRIDDTVAFINNAHRTNYKGAGKNDYGTGLPHPVNEASLSNSPCLQNAAHYWADHMARTEDFSHSKIPDWINFFCGSGWSWTGENIGWYHINAGYEISTTTLATRIATSYLKSKSHHEHIDGSVFYVVGYGAVKESFSDGSYTMWTVQEFADHTGGK
ncbi:MAG: hypothetical protein JWS12_486 [Candidatus Saccharibacteria bacterium]|nr:hypothetical protein [Candidatus Saccharibacteria bacterium]